jgi:hypothetical protein
MDIPAILTELHEELARVTETIAALERLTIARKRRGRPPKWLGLVKRKTKRGRPSGSKNKNRAA